MQRTWLMHYIHHTCKSRPMRSLTHDFTSARSAFTLMRPSLPRRLINWSGFTTNFYSTHTDTNRERCKLPSSHANCITYIHMLMTMARLEFIQKQNTVTSTGSTSTKVENVRVTLHTRLVIYENYKASWVVCLFAAPQVKLFASVEYGWPRNALQHEASLRHADQLSLPRL